MPTSTPPAIYCYSKSGHTRHAADALAELTGAEVVPVRVDRYKVPVLWFIRAIWDALQGHLPPLTSGDVVVKDRPWIVVACPVWADQPAAPGRSLLTALAASTVPVGVLTTSGGNAEQIKSVRACEEVLNRPLTASVNIHNKIDETPEMRQHLDTFANEMMSCAAKGAA